MAKTNGTSKRPNSIFMQWRPQKNQLAQLAVLDTRVGDKDLQQYADAMLRLRAEYFLIIIKPISSVSLPGTNSLSIMIFE